MNINTINRNRTVTPTATRNRAVPQPVPVPQKYRMLHICAVGKVLGEPYIEEKLCLPHEREKVMVSLMKRIDDATVFVMG